LLGLDWSKPFAAFLAELARASTSLARFSNALVLKLTLGLAALAGLGVAAGLAVLARGDTNPLLAPFFVVEI